MLIAVTFLVSFAWSSVYVGIPFYVQRVSQVDPASTLAWTGWILGITPLVSMASSPLWARQAAHGDLRTTFVVVQVLQALGFLAAAFVDSLPTLFAVRLLLGTVGVASTLALMLAGRAPEPGERRRQLALIQSANMAGQVAAPMVGAVAAARLGFRLSFALGALLLAACGALIQWRMTSTLPTGPAPAARRRRRLPVRLLVLTSTVVLIGSSQEAFLAAMLPQVLPQLGVRPERLVESAGMLIFVSGLAAAVGGLAAPRLAAELPPRRFLPVLLGASSVGLIAFSAAGSLWLYAALRTVQSLCLAPLFPLVVGSMSRHGGGEAIGVLNAARAGGNFLGPVVATSLLAWAPPPVVYLLLGAAGLATIPWTRR